MSLRRRMRPIMHLTSDGGGEPPDPVAAGLPGPESVGVRARHVELGGHLVRTLAVTGYPREVSAGWLEPLLSFPGRLDVAIHIEPIPAEVAAQRLRRQIARLESDRQIQATRRQVADPQVDAAADDATELAGQLARGEQKLFTVGVYLAVHAGSEQELDDATARVRAVASGLLLDVQVTTYRSLQGWTTTLPYGVDTVGIGRSLDTSATAAGYPFASPDQAGRGGGVLVGVNPTAASIVTCDRWSQDSYGSVVLARSGAGKSYLAKLGALRELYAGVRVAVVDPENEYQRLAEAVGGAYLRLGAPGVTINPLDLQPGDDPITDRALFLHTLVAVLAGTDGSRETLSGAQRAALDRAIIACYATAGITGDPRTWGRPAPLLRDLAAALDAEDDAGQDLAARLAPHVSGSHAGLWSAPTTTAPAGHLVVWCLQDLDEALKPAATLLSLDAIWRRVTDASRRDLVIVDEAWLLMQSAEGARWLYRLAKSARKYWTGLEVISQDAADLLATDLGRAVVANAATQILLAQAPQAIDEITDAFGLSAGEREWLLTAARGQGLLAAGTADRTAFEAVASAAEHDLITTDPAELATRTPITGAVQPREDRPDPVQPSAVAPSFGVPSVGGRH